MRKKDCFMLLSFLFSLCGTGNALLAQNTDVEKNYPILSHYNEGRAPSNRILMRGDRNIYAILHFGVNTFTDREWGYGDENPQIFNPTDFDAEQIAKACRDGGITGVIIVCKHHDGLCLWPTKTTEHNITKTKFRDGKGDYVKEMSDALRKYGLDVGFYVSPWDRNSAAYGTPEYLKIYQEQLREVLSNYGQAFEVFLDGANGGDGYYGGARERRTIDHRTYYDWMNTWQIIRELQPNAAIFSDIGPDVRWIGNEAGLANEDAFCSFTPHAPGSGEAMPGYCRTNEALSGHEDGLFFIPGDCDVPLQPGWFYHASNDRAQKSVQHLIQIYLRSAGNGAYMNLGLAPDKRGRLCDNDVKRLKEFKEAVDSLFQKKVFGDEISLKNDEGIVYFGEKRKINFIKLAENLSSTRGEQVLAYTVSVRENGNWVDVVSGKAIGLNRLKKFNTRECDAIRIKVTKCVSPVYGLRFSGYLAPAELLGEKPAATDAGKIRSQRNYVKIESFRKNGLSTSINLPEGKKIKGIVFTPTNPSTAGTPDKYVVETRKNGGDLTKIAEGEFSNIKANPVPQLITFEAFQGRRLQIRATHTLGEAQEMDFAEIGVLLAD